MLDMLITDARVLTLDHTHKHFERADVAIHEGRIVHVDTRPQGQQAPEAAQVIDGRNRLVMPGLINAHFHSPGNLMKGFVPNLPLELFMLYEVPPLLDETTSERLAYVRTAIGIIEMLKSGVTSVHDDAFFVPIVTQAEVRGIMTAYGDSGMRATVALDQPNVVEYEKYPFLRELLPETIRKTMDQTPRMSDEALVECYGNFMSDWHGSHANRLRTSVSCSAPQRVTSNYLKALGKIATQYDIPFNMHILETRLQRVLGDMKFDQSLVRYAHEQGVLTEQAQVIHAVWIDDEDIELLAASGCTVAHNPIANLKLGSGVMPFRRLRDAGINLCLGSDEATVSDGVNMWIVARMAGLIHNISDPEYRNWPSAREVLTTLTRGGAQAMRQQDRIGSITPGYQADLIILDMDSLAFSPLNDLERQLVYCETGSSVVMTIVDGQIVYENGRVLYLDEHAIMAEARSHMEEYRRLKGATEEGVAQLENIYRQMYLHSLKEPVGIDRWIGRQL